MMEAWEILQLFRFDRHQYTKGLTQYNHKIYCQKVPDCSMATQHLRVMNCSVHDQVVMSLKPSSSNLGYVVLSKPDFNLPPSLPRTSPEKPSQPINQTNKTPTRTTLCFPSVWLFENMCVMHCGLQSCSFLDQY